MDERQKINYAKSELRNYMFLLNVCKGFDDKIVKLETAIADVKSPTGMASIESSGAGGDEVKYRRTELLDRLQRAQVESLPFRARVDHINSFLDNLEYEDRRIVTDIYIKNYTIEKTATWLYCSEKTLKRRINEIMSRF